MPMENIPGLASKASPGQSSADAWKDQPAPAPGLLSAHTKLLLNACNTMLCCSRTVLEVGKIPPSFCERNEEL